VPVGLELIYADGFTGGYPVSHAGLWVPGRNDDDITQAAGTPKQCFKTGSVDTIVIGYDYFQNVFSTSPCR
jgi:hypothetical protein